MPFAICFDTSMLVGLLIFLLFVGVVVAAVVVSAVAGLLQWLNARGEGLTAES